MEDGTSVGNNLLMRQSGKNKGTMTFIMDESSKLSSCNDGDEPKKQKGDHLVANKVAIIILVENNCCIERFDKEGAASAQRTVKE